MKERSLAIASTLAALLASLCCLGPLVLGGAGLGAVLVATFAPLRPYFLAVSGVLLAGGFYLVYRRPKAAEACAGETCAPESRTRRMAKPLLWVAAFAVAALAFFPSYVTTAKVDYNTGEAQLQFDAKKTTPEKIVAAFNQANSGFRVEQSKPSAK
jgi:mercuric ion transport protein